MIAGGYFALAIALVFGSALSVAVHASGRRNVSYLLFALVALLTAVYSWGLGLLYAGSPGSWIVGLKMARSSAALSVAAGLHFALLYARLQHARLVSLGVWTVALSIAVGVVAEPVQLQLVQWHTLTGAGLQARVPWSPPGSASAFLALIGPATLLAAVAAFALAWSRGRREAFGLMLGTAALWLTVFNDCLVSFGAVRGFHLAPLGVLAQAFGVAVYFVARYSAASGELSRKGKELRERVAELGQTRKELHAIQTELGRKQQLAAIGEMAAVIAHEVRNPLAVISNAVASLKREGLCRQDHDVLLKILEEESVRLNRLVSDLLAYARPISPQRQRVILQDLVQRAALLVGNRGTAKFDFDDDSARGQIWADGNLLRQVFDNLIENAVQAMGGVGTVTVSVKMVTQDGADGFAVSVADEGEGMDTIVRSRAKDPFFTTRPAGTGLGLAIVDRIVEAHGGHVTLDSRAGEGTTVTVFLPIGSESIPPPESMRSERPRRPGSESGLGAGA